MFSHWSKILEKFPPSSVFPEAGSDDCYFSPLDCDILEVKGTDSCKFLQGQTTCNLDQLDQCHWMPGAICDPKGRMITSFSLYLQTPDHLLLEMNNGLAAITRQAITRYSAFYKADLEDISSSWHVTGVVGQHAAAIITEATGLGLTDESSFASNQDFLLIKVSDTRFKLLSRTEKTAAFWASLSLQGKAVSNPFWQYLDICEGIGNVHMETSGELIPQMLNLQARGGISFRKGCYTGQEIVARMKYRGKLKRRMYHLQAATDKQPPPGTPCLAEPGGSVQGNVVNAISTGNGQLEMLAVMTVELAESGKLHFGDEAPVWFTIKPLPYSLDS